MVCQAYEYSLLLVKHFQVQKPVIKVTVAELYGQHIAWWNSDGSLSR